ncbi:MAG TPA: family 20 glycosylhydrolase [Bryobacteraceae bacterium]
MRTTRSLCAFGIAALWSAAGLSAQSSLPLMPWPAQVVTNEGTFRIGAGFSISISGAGAADVRLKLAAQRTIARLASQTGVPLTPLTGAQPPSTSAPFQVAVERRDHPAPQRLADSEEYSLRINGDGVRLSADGPLGVLRGFETFLQLVTPCAGDAPGFCAPAVEIHDQPRFPWRGLSLDVSRHFIPVDGIKRTIDGLAAVKLNVLHWHLSDDQGFRVESKKYPRLQQAGSDGLYYTQAEIRDVVAYARDRGVRIVPEFDVPGHSTSWLAAYPNLASKPGPFQIVHDKGDPSGVMDPIKESTYAFLDGLFGEMARLFPDEYFHIGGDEVSAREWTSQPRIVTFMKAHKLANAKTLHAYFNKRLQKILAKHGKKMVGWEEILTPDLPKSVLVQSWRGPKSLAEAASQGFPAILSAGYYLDLMQSAGQHYAIEPLSGDAADLAPEEQARILGGEAAMWEELVTAETLDAKLWPRLAAIAERFWSPQSVTDPVSMYARLDRVDQWLEWLGLTQRSELEIMRQRLAGGLPVAPLDAFAALLEPVKGYERHRAPYGATTPFNRLVDAIPPESDASRIFSGAVDRYLAGYPDATGPPAANLLPDAHNALAVLLRAQLAAWSRTAAQVRPLLESNSLLTEDLPVADAVVALCKFGQEALDYSGSPAPDGWKQRTIDAVKAASKHNAELLIPFAPSIQKLVEAVH